MSERGGVRFTCAICGYVRVYRDGQTPEIGAPVTITFDIEPWNRPKSGVLVATVTFPPGTPICHLHTRDRQALARRRFEEIVALANARAGEGGPDVAAISVTEYASAG